MGNVARLGVVMGLDTAEFTTGLKKVDSQLDSFKEKILEFASVAAFTEMTKQAMEYADGIVKTAKANDVATASVLELSKALEENGGSAEDTAMIYAGFNQKVEAAALGSAKGQEAFARLGVSMKDLQTLSSQDLFEKTITGLAKIDDSVTRNGLAFQTLGKAIRGVDIKGLADTLEELHGSMDKYAASVEAAHALHLELEASGKKVVLLFTDAFIPTLKIIYDDLNKTGNMLETFFKNIKDFMVELGIVFEYAKTGIMDVVSAVQNGLLYMNNILKLNFKDAGENTNQFLKDVNDNYQHFLDIRQKLVDSKDATGSSGADEKANREIIDSMAKQLGMANQLAEKYRESAERQLQQVIAQRELLTLTKDEATVQQAINKVKQDAQKTLDDINTKIAAAQGQGAAGQRLIAVYKKQQDEIINTRDIYMDATKQEVQATIDFQRTFEFGWNKAWNQYKEDASNNAQMAQDAFSAVTGQMSTSLELFLNKGQFDFKSFATAIIGDIQRIIAKWLIMKAITGIAGMASGGGGTDYTEGSGNSVMGANATGGTLNSGQPSMVGEQGPELFIPQSAGTVIPNNQLSGALAGMGSGVTYNGPYINSMSAIDTQSATQFLARNQNAVWGAYQSAQRGMPQTR